MRLNPIVLVTALALFILSQTTFAQAARTDSLKIPHAYWVSVGVGASSLGDLEIMGNINAEIGNQWLLTGIAQSEASFFGSGSDNVETFGLLGGKTFKTRSFLFTTSAGIAIMQVDSKNKIGVPILLQSHWVILQKMGIGLNAYANLNSITTSAGFNITFALGRIATHK